MTEADDPIDSLWPFIGLALVVLLVMAGTGLVLWSSFEDLGQRGQFGDMFGVANALFSGLAFSGLIYALVLQRRELTLQRRELRLTRTELQKQASAQSDQAKTSLLAARIEGYGALLAAAVQQQATASNKGVSSNHGERVKELQKILEALLNEAAT